MNETDLIALRKFLGDKNELILLRETGKTFALKSKEIELEFSHNRTLIGFLDIDGYQTWRIVKTELKETRAVLFLAKNFQTESARIELIARKETEQLKAEVELARLERANSIGKLLVSENAEIKLTRVELNRENGRFAQILIADNGNRQIAVLADMTDKISPEGVLSFAINWISNLKRRKKNPIEEIWLISSKTNARILNRLRACLQETWKERFKIFEHTRINERSKLRSIKPIRMSDLWRRKPKRLGISQQRNLSNTSKEIIKLAPIEIDFEFSNGGETLRYLGLPFFRLRKVSGNEKAWFQTGKNRRELGEDSLDDFSSLVNDLKKYRSFESPNRFHLFYETAPEAWLESILRRNIKLLDANLILSPIFNQFRTSRDKIDLLALRKDGRLVIIELKVSPDREMIFQAVDYWRKIEHQRRKGILNEARLFGEREIADRPVIIYLVAPALSYHPDFRFFSKTISEDIEIYRFDLATNWREEIEVLSRKRLPE